MLHQNFFEIDFRTDNATAVWEADFHLGPQDVIDEIPEALRYCIKKMTVEEFKGYDGKSYWRLVLLFDENKVFYLDWKNAKWFYKLELRDIPALAGQSFKGFSSKEDLYQYYHISEDKAAKNALSIVRYLATEYTDSTFVKSSSLVREEV